MSGTKTRGCLLINAEFYGCHLRRLHVRRRAADWLQGEKDGGKNTLEGEATPLSEYHANVALVAFYSFHLGRVGQSCPRS